MADFNPMNKLLQICLSILFGIAGFLGCSDAGKSNTYFLGTWRMESNSGQYTIMALKNNNTFQIDLRIEGRLTKIVDKKGSATGTWDIGTDGSHLVLNVTQGDASIGWPEGEALYRIEQIDNRSLVLASPDGNTYHWKKSGQKNEAPESEEPGAVVTIAPLVVNLLPGDNELHQRYKWLCVAMDLRLSPGAPQPKVRPQWKDKIILLLSSKTYEEINTLDKLEIVSNEIHNLLNPYLDGAIDRVTFNRTIVTGRQEAVDTFCAEYQP